MSGAALPGRLTTTARRRFERAVEHYLHYCYRLRTAARASELAEHVNLAPAHLSRIVPLMVGQPLRAYLWERQLAYAAHLLRSTPLPVEQIALASAFGTVSTFYRRFVDAFGQTPATYRERFLTDRRDVTLGLPAAAMHPERRVPFSLTGPTGGGSGRRR